MGISFYQPSSIPVDERDRRRAVTSSNLLNPVLAPAIAAITYTAARLAGTRMAAATLLLDDHVVILGNAGLNQNVAPRSSSLCGHVILRAPVPLCIPDTHRDARFAENPIVTDAPFVRFYFGTPLLATNGQPLGALCVFDDRPRDGISHAVASQLRVMSEQIVAMGTTNV